MSGRRLALALSCPLALLTAAAGAPALAADDPWTTLAAARSGFEDAAWTADFVQTWVPAGFSTGERETGRVSLALPGALRWDYEVPFPKSLLVRLDTAYSWNPGESSGRRVFLAAEEREHLALLELDLETLRGRFTAKATGSASGGASKARIEVTLTPRADDVEIRDARLTFEATTHRLLALAYSDAEGNRTEFAFSGHRPVAGVDPFTPPDGLEWLTD